MDGDRALTTNEVKEIKSRILDCFNRLEVYPSEIARAIQIDRKTIYYLYGMQQGYTFGTKAVEVLRYFAQEGIDVNYILTGKREWVRSLTSGCK